MNYDITYCTYAGCPFKDCERHLTRLEKQTNRTVSIADFRGTCRLYIGLLIDEVREEEHK